MKQNQLYLINLDQVLRNIIILIRKQLQNTSTQFQGQQETSVSKKKEKEEMGQVQIKHIVFWQ